MALDLDEKQARVPSFEGEFTVDGTTSDYLIIPAFPGRNIAVCVIPGANSGKVQYTISTLTKVAAGTATWHDWPQGSVFSNTVDHLKAPVTAIRFVASGGEVTFEVQI